MEIGQNRGVENSSYVNTQNSNKLSEKIKAVLVEPSQINLSKKDEAPKNPNIDDISEVEKELKEKEQEQLKEKIKEINEQMKSLNTDLKFNYDERIDGLHVKVVDSKTDKLIREFPTEEMIKFSVKMKEISGLIIDFKG